jgi:hypothetical protein
MACLKRAVGMDGQVELHKDRIIITRKGFFAMLSHGIKPQRELPLGAITTVEFQDAGIFNKGYINFLYAGNIRKSGETVVKFSRKENEIFRSLKEEIFLLMNNNNRG